MLNLYSFRRKSLFCQRLLISFVCCLTIFHAFGQSSPKTSTFLLTQYNYTLQDYTSGNNPWALGLGLQTFLNNRGKLKPTVELTTDLYLEDDKVLRLDPNDSIPIVDNTVRSMINLFAGASFHPTQTIYVSCIAGPSFIGGKTFFGIKPSLGFFFSGLQRWTGKFSYIHVFNRMPATGDDFTSVSLAIGCRLF